MLPMIFPNTQKATLREIGSKEREPRFRVRFVAVLLAGLAAAHAAVADTELQTSLAAGLSGIQTQVSPTGPISDSITGSGPAGLASAAAFARADFGPLEAENESTAVALENTAGFSTAIVRDDITITPDDPALNATEGRIVFELRPLGVLRHDPNGVDPLSDSADGLASWRVAVTGAESPGEYRGNLFLRPGLSGFGFEEELVGTPLGTPLVFERLVFFGFPTELEILLTTQTDAAVTDFAPTEAAYRAFAGVVMAWDGIVEVQDRFGNVVADYTLTSGSGTNWRLPVPEPGFAIALLVGAGALAFRWASLATRTRLAEKKIEPASIGSAEREGRRERALGGLPSPGRRRHAVARFSSARPSLSDRMISYPGTHCVASSDIPHELLAGGDRMRLRRGSGWAAGRAALLALALVWGASPAQSQISYSPDVTVQISGTVVSDEDTALDDLGGSVGVTDLGSLPTAAEVDAYSLDGGDRLFSLDITSVLPGGLVARPADVVRYDGASYTLAFDALAAGVPAGANVDAVSVAGSGLHLSFDTTVDLGGGVTPADEDLVLFLGGGFVLSFDGSAAGLDESLDLDAANVQADGSFVLSLDHGGTIGGVVFDDDTVLIHDGANWAVAVDASDLDPAFGAADLVAVPEPNVGLALALGAVAMLGARILREEGR